MKGKEVASRIVPNEQARDNKISWKRVTGASPIYKVDPPKRKPSVSPYDELPLIESKVDSSEDSKKMMPSYSPYNDFYNR